MKTDIVELALYLLPALAHPFNQLAEFLDDCCIVRKVLPNIPRSIYCYKCTSNAILLLRITFKKHLS